MGVSMATMTNTCTSSVDTLLQGQLNASPEPVTALRPQECWLHRLCDPYLYTDLLCP